METRPVAWSDGKPLKYQSFLTYQDLRLISDPCRTADMAREDLRRLVKKQQLFVQKAIEEWDAITDAPQPEKQMDNSKVEGLIDFV